MAQNQSTFEKEVIKGLEPKTPKTTAKQITRLAESNIKAQIHALEGSIVRKEMAIEVLEETENKAFYTTNLDLVNDGEKYLKGIIDASKATEKAKAELQEAKDLKDRLEGWLVRFE